MEFSTRSGNPAKQRTGCVVAGVFSGRKLSPAAAKIDSGESLRPEKTPATTHPVRCFAGVPLRVLNSIGSSWPGA